ASPAAPPLPLEPSASSTVSESHAVVPATVGGDPPPRGGRGRARTPHSSVKSTGKKTGHHAEPDPARPCHRRGTHRGDRRRLGLLRDSELRPHPADAQRGRLDRQSRPVPCPWRS